MDQLTDFNGRCVLLLRPTRNALNRFVRLCQSAIQWKPGNTLAICGCAVRLSPLVWRWTDVFLRAPALKNTRKMNSGLPDMRRAEALQFDRQQALAKAKKPKRPHPYTGTSLLWWQAAENDLTIYNHSSYLDTI